MKLIVLDRDGVINEDSDEFIKSPDEWVPIEGSIEAITRLSRKGYSVAVATNQSGLARGYFDLEALSAMHRKLDDLLSQYGGRVDAVFFCPHGPNANCDCRKPKPGLLLDIAQRFQTSMVGVPVVGDSLRDLESAAAVGASPILVRTGKGKKTEANLPDEFRNVPIYDDLAGAVDAVLARYLAEV